MRAARIGLYWAVGGAIRSKRDSFVVWVCVRAQGPRWDLVSTLTLGTACILAAGGYVDGTQPWEERGARRDSVIVRAVVCIVRALRTEGLVRAGMVSGGTWNAEGAGAFLQSRLATPDWKRWT